METEPNAERRFQIKEQMDTLLQNMNKLEAEVERTRTRLTPISHRESKVEEVSDKPKMQGGLVPHAEELDAINLRLFNAATELCEAIDNLEI